MPAVTFRIKSAVNFFMYARLSCYLYHAKLSELRRIYR